MTEIIEQWRPIEGYEGLYQVSNLGRVRSLGNDKKRKEKILRPLMNNCGYLLVNLSKEGKQKMFSVHRLVAQTFIPNPEGLPEINHRDENPSNARAENLEWCDHRYNMNDGTRTERATKNRLRTRINNGTYDSEMCGIDRKEYERLKYQKNRERILEYQRERYQKNREQILEQKQEYYQKNRERILEQQREYYQKNRLKKKKNNHPSEESLW